MGTAVGYQKEVCRRHGWAVQGSRKGQPHDNQGLAGRKSSLQARARQVANKGAATDSGTASMMWGIWRFTGSSGQDLRRAGPMPVICAPLCKT